MSDPVLTISVDSLAEFLASCDMDFKIQHKKAVEGAMKITKEKLAYFYKKYGKESGNININILKNEFKSYCLMATEADSSIVFKHFDDCFEFLTNALEDAEEAVREGDWVDLDGNEFNEENYRLVCEGLKGSFEKLQFIKKNYEKYIQ